jgi:Flp pilus assembly CpaE family ATPase
MSGGLILLLGADERKEALVSAALAEFDDVRLLAVQRAGMALARLGGGDATLVLVDAAFLEQIPGDGGLATLRAAAGKAPLVMLASGKGAGAAKMDGFAAVVFEADWGTRLPELVRASLPVAKGSFSGAKKGQVIAFTGAKGGSGVTTVASNVANALSQEAKVILAEIQPAPGGLAPYFRLSHSTQTLEHLAAMDPRKLDTAAVEKMLWFSRGAANLKFLFASQNLEQLEELPAAKVSALVGLLAELAEYVVLDLPPVLSAGTRAAIQASDVLAILVERDAFALEAAEAKLKALQMAGITPGHVGAIVVSKAPLGAPMAISEFATRLGVEMFGYVPPAPDLCAAANKRHITVSVLDGESLVARSLGALAGAVTGKTGQAFGVGSLAVRG